MSSGGAKTAGGFDVLAALPPLRWLALQRWFPLGLAVVMLLGGLWHGAKWNFVVWGAYHGALLCLERWRGKQSATQVLNRAKSSVLSANVWKSLIPKISFERLTGNLQSIAKVFHGARHTDIQAIRPDPRSQGGEGGWT